MIVFDSFKTLCFSSLVFTSIMGAEEAPKAFHPEASKEEREEAQILGRQVVDFWFSAKGGDFFAFLADRDEQDNTGQNQNNLKKMLDRVSDSDDAKKYLKKVWTHFPFNILVINEGLKKHRQAFANNTLSKLEWSKRETSKNLMNYFISNWVASIKSAKKLVNKTIAKLNETDSEQWIDSLSACPLNPRARKVRNAMVQMYIWIVYAFLPEFITNKIVPTLDKSVVQNLRDTVANMKRTQAAK